MTKPNIKVVALDPGITTGYATGVITDGKLGAVSGQAKWNEKGLYDQLSFSQPDAIVYESFEYRYTKRRGSDLTELFSRNLIGVINLYVQQRAVDGDSCGCYTQTPGQALGQYFTDRKLKDGKMYKTANPHANDAMRHLLHWFTFGGGFQYNTNGYEPLA